MYEPPEATRHHNSLRLLILLPVRTNLLCTLQCETPCMTTDCSLNYKFNTWKLQAQTWAVMPEPGGPGHWGHWPPQYLADQLTLFEPGRADYPHLLLLASPMFFTFRHHCTSTRNCSLLGSWCFYWKVYSKVEVKNPHFSTKSVQFF